MRQQHKANMFREMREEVNIMENKAFLTVEEVAAEMGVSKSYAYKIVKKLNEELQQMGYLTVAGRINANYFRKKVCYTETA